MKYTLAVRDLAEQDLTKAYDFYEAEQEGLGRRFHDEVAVTLRRIQENPLMYPAVDKPGYHKAALAVFPFCIYYYITSARIAVVAVHDCRRDPDIWKERLR